jgi:hypothetical protein
MDGTVYQRVKQFDEKHGGERYSEGGMFFFADGSMREVDPTGVLLGCEQLNVQDAKQEYDLMLRKYKFVEVKLKKAVQAFDELNERLLYFHPPNENEELKRLCELQKLIEALKPEVEKALAAVDATRFGAARKANLEAIANQQRRFDEFQKRRKAIRI